LETSPNAGARWPHRRNARESAESEGEKLEQVGALETECRARAGEDAEDGVVERTGRRTLDSEHQERNGPRKTGRPAGDGAPGGARNRGGERALAELTALLVQRCFVWMKASKPRSSCVAAGQPVSARGSKSMGARRVDEKALLHGERSP